MSMSLSYVGDRSRVQIEVSSLDPDGIVAIEHSASSSGPWTSVRGGSTHAFTNFNGLTLHGDSGDYASTPDDPTLDITGSLDLRADVTLDDWTPASIAAFIAKYDVTSDQRQYLFRLNTNGTLDFIHSEDGVNTLNATSSVAVTPGSTGRLAVRAVLDVDNGSGHDVTFYTARSIAGPWQQLGSAQTNAAVTSIFGGGSESLEVGAFDSGQVSPLDGIIHAAEVYNGIDGTRVAAPYFAQEGDEVTSFTGNEGLEWTIHGDAVNRSIPVITLNDYEFYADVVNYYRVRRITPQPGLLTGQPGGYASTPDAASLDITGDIDIRADMTVTRWEVDDSQIFAAKRDSDAGQESWQFYLNSSGQINFAWWDSGQVLMNVTGNVVTNAIDVVDGSRVTLRATLDADTGSSSHTTTFYHSDAVDGQFTSGFGTPETNSGTTSIFNSDTRVEIGTNDLGTQNHLYGTVHKVWILDGINGTVVASPDFAAQDDGATTFDDAQGNTWSINGDARILGEVVEPAQSITPDLEGVTWLKSIKYPALNRPLGEAPQYRPIQRSSRTGVFNTKGRTPPVAVYDAWTSRWWTIEFVTNTLAEARDMDLILAASRTLFLHVPTEDANECFTNPVSGMPGGYVMAQNATMSHAVDGSHSMQWVLPVRVVAPPDPEVTSTVTTWKTLQRLYGSWQALWASSSSWQDVWELIMGPEDAVSL